MDVARSSVRRAEGPSRTVTGSPAENHREESVELAEVRAQLRELQQTIEAIRTGGVDSLIVGPPGQEQVYALATADRSYRLIVEAMNEGAATVSTRGVILDANPRLGSMTGQDASELIGTPVLDLILAAHRPAFARLLDVGAGDSTRGEVDLTGAGGMTVPVLLAVSGFDLDGMLLRCLVLTDLTAQRAVESQVGALTAELEARVEQRTAELERSNKNLQSFAYSVAHDLSTPLRGLSGFSEVLLEEYGELLGETGRGYAGRIQAASERMATVIDDLLRLSQVSRADLNLVLVDLSAEVVAIADRLRSRDPGRRVSFAIQDGVWVTADRILIRAVLENLVGNAWKFTARRDDATIEFATATITDDEATVCCYVRDNGVGFDPAYVDKLFQPFQRLHTAGEFPGPGPGPGTGTGMGLVSVQRIIERHGGRTWAQGAVDGGATFYFTLRAKDTP
jgi:PAS domain S-box-containing protein